MKSWKTAPDFSIKDLQEKTVSLKDYKGQWLLLDFWGTWCAPCRKEMPQVQAFYDQIEAGKIKNLSFLSIATYDTPEDVKTFFRTHNYHLPAAMGSSSLAKAYEVPGYPSKVLISPEGKWIPLQFGSEWQKIIKKYLAIYEESLKDQIPQDKQKVKDTGLD